MVPIQFFLQNFHFAENLFAALVFFAIVWLYVDAWIVRKERKELYRWVGFALLSISFLLHAAVTEQSATGSSSVGSTVEIFSILLRILGYAAVAYGIFIDPLPEVPLTASLQKVRKHPAVLLLPLLSFLKILLPIGSGLAAYLYWRRATLALERQLKLLAYAFGALTLFELLSLASLLRGSTNLIVYNLTAAFGPLWIIEHLFLLAGAILLARWVWSYLMKQIQTQLLMLLTTITMAIFLITTMSFTFLLFRNLERETLGNLATAAKVLDYALDSKQAEILAETKRIAEKSDVAAAVVAKDHSRLASLGERLLEEKELSHLIITTEAGQVLLRAEDPDRWGDSLSDDPLVKKALTGEAGSSVAAQEDVLAPVIVIQSAAPIRDGARIVGSVVAGVVADDAFLDGIKNLTGLDSAVYAGNIRSATTLVAPDGTSRWVGVKEENPDVQRVVLEEGGTFQGSLAVLNRPFLGVYAPLTNVDNSTVGMLFIGQPAVALLETAARSIEVTFLVAIALLLLSIVPSYKIAKYIAYQVK